MTSVVAQPLGTEPPSRLVAALARHGDAPAAITTTGTTTYLELAARVAATAAALGPVRRLVLVEARRDLPWLVGYLAALAAGCPVLLVPPGGAAEGSAAVARYDPDVRLGADGQRVRIDEVRAAPLHDLHPDLAVLLSTSGSTGSPKLVRLSAANLLANAEAVAVALGIRVTDRAPTTLPVEYCYGLSIVHSHVLRGAALVLTDLSVTDPDFWSLFGAAGGTCLAGVPYTFDLLDSVGFDGMHLPHLRYVTQAGGRLAPSRVRAYAELGTSRGWDFFVMYGQTEATARMAVLPPHLAALRPTAIGLPVPGGRFEIESVRGASGEVGELVYEGPNVMLGYATSPADLALGAVVHRLRTGDLARRCPDGLYEVVGRSARSLKLFGLRLDLAYLESVLAAEGVTACCEPTPDGRLGVVVEQPGAPAAVLARLTALVGLPGHAVRAVAVDALPRTRAGKVDLAAVRARLGPAEQERERDVPSPDVRTLFERVLGREAGATDTFVGLGGDSLSYVEMAVGLEALLPHVPTDWHTRTVGELSASVSGAVAESPRRRTRLETTVALRAAAIVAVVGSHADLFHLVGGAHLLLVVAGYNLARFQLAAPRRSRCVAVARSVRRIVVPTVLWVGVVAAVAGTYGWRNAFLLNHALGPQEWGPTWRLWFVEALVVLLVSVTALLAVPAVAAVHRARPFVLAMALCGLGLLVRFDLLPVPTGPRDRFTAQAVLWLFALGMAAAAAHGRRQRLLVAAVAAIGLHGWFGATQRELLILGGVVLLLTVRQVPSTVALNRLAGALASASLYVYVTHWDVFPLFRHPAVGVVAALLVGLAYWQLVRAGGILLAAVARRATRPPQACRAR